MPLIRLRSSSIIESVHLGGTPTASNPSTQIATVQQVNQAISDLVGTAPEVLNTLAELASSLGTDGNQV